MFILNKKTIVFIILCVAASITLFNCRNEFYQTLKVINGEGGTITLPAENPKKVVAGEAEIIEATPLGYYEFSHWSNENNGSAAFENAAVANTKVRIYADTEIKANFILRTSILNIKSNVINASAWVDAVLIGKTPATAKVNYGTHQIRVSYVGYGEYNETIIVDVPEITVSAMITK